MSRKDHIMDIAEREMRRGGIDAVSFRDIASEVGIKSASVHYHFPTKADLTKAVVDRYKMRFLEGLGTPDASEKSPRDRVLHLADAYIDTFRTDGTTCLCAVLGSVTDHVPNDTAEAVNAFYQDLINWTDSALDGTAALSANVAISTLQGAMVLGIARQSEAPLAEARAFLADIVDNTS